MEKLNSIKNFATKTLEKIAALDKDNWLFEYIDKEKLSEKIAEDLTNDMKNLIKQE